MVATVITHRHGTWAGTSALPPAPAPRPDQPTASVYQCRDSRRILPPGWWLVPCAVLSAGAWGLILSAIF